MNPALQAIPEAESAPRSLRRFLVDELRPKGKLLTVFNLITVPIMLAAAVILAVRFVNGLGSVSNLDQEYPWGLWKGFNVITGVAFAGGAYVLTFIVYVLNQKKYETVIRATVLNGFLAYVFYAGALLLDLGRPWNVMNPIIGNSFGVSSVLFLVAWHFLLYMIAELIEFSPAVAEWLRMPRARKVLKSMTLGAVVLGISLSMLHQSGLGALYLMTKGKLHPLWYTEFLPVLFLVSSVFAGLSLVILEGSLSRSLFAHRMGPMARNKHRGIVVGLSRICAGALFVYLFLKVLTFVHGHGWEEIGTGWGAWYAFEVIGFVAVPCVMFAVAYHRESIVLIRTAAVVAMLGVMINRLNVSIIAFKWDAPDRYIPSWMEIEVALAVICAQIWAFRWFISRMPVLDRLIESPPPADTKLAVVEKEVRRHA